MDINGYKFLIINNIPLFYAEMLYFFEINLFDYINQYGLNNERQMKIIIK